MKVAQTLWDSPLDLQVQVDSLSEELQDKYQQRLIDLGLGPGHIVSCIRQTPFGGPRVYRVSGSVFSLEKEIAKCIFVREAQ